MRYSRPRAVSTKRSAVSSGRPRYSCASWTPPSHSSPVTPTPTGCNAASSTKQLVFQTGRPIGTLWPSAASAAVQSHTVTSTAASVGPYRLVGATPNHFRLPATRSGVSASPLVTTARGSPAATVSRAGRSPRKARSMDGTKCNTATRSATISAASARGSRCVPGGAITTQPPTCSGVGGAGLDHVAADAAGGQLEPGAAGERRGGGLGRRVGQHAESRHPGGVRADHHDRAAVAQPGSALLQQVEHPGGVDGEVPLPGLL